MCRSMASNKPSLSSRLNLRGNGPVRRSLFGPVDSRQLKQEYHAALRQDMEEASRRWGYDFALDRPLKDGGFQWEVISGTKVPRVYRPNNLGAKRAAGPSKAGRVAPPRREKENIPENENDENVCNNWKRGERTPQKESLKRKQTNITDFYQAKRRMVMQQKSAE